MEVVDSCALGVSSTQQKMGSKISKNKILFLFFFCIESVFSIILRVCLYVCSYVIMTIEHV